MNVRQSIVIRRDLQMDPGLLAAQAAHISAQFMMEENGSGSVTKFSDVETQWFGSPVISVLAVNTPEELDVLIDLAKKVGVNFTIWRDTIPSKIFAGQFLEVKVGVAFGPDDNEKIKQITGVLPLF